MKKKLLAFAIGAAGVLSLASCGKNDSKGSKTNEVTSSVISSSTTPVEQKYSIKVIDIDGAVLSNETYDITETSKVVDDIKEINGIKAVTYQSEYGTTVSSVAGSIMDNNYYVAIYENGEATQTGVDGLVIDAGDEFTFKVECWNVPDFYGTMDANDILLDKVLYSYYKKMNSNLSSVSNYTGSDYWSFMNAYLMKSNGYDSNFFKYVDSDLNSDLDAAITNTTVSSLTGANIGKYYYTSRLYNKTDESSLKTQLTSVMADMTSYGSEYTTPFMVSPAYKLGLSDNVPLCVRATDYLPSISWGYDGYGWFLQSQALFTDSYKTSLAQLPTETQGNSVSDSIVIATYAAYNESAKTLVDNLLTNYYDSETNTIKYNAAGSASNGFDIQVYANLSAYKVQRDLNHAANLFE